MNDPSTNRTAADEGIARQSGQPEAPGKKVSLASRVEPLLSTGQFDQAEKLILSTPKSSRNDWNYYVLLARVWAAQNRPQEALEALRHATSVAPLRAIPHWRLAEFLLKRGDLAEAEVEARRAIGIDPSGHSFHSTLASVLIHQCCYDEALSSIKRAIRLNRKHPQPHIVLAELYSAQRKYRRAESALKKALQLAPKSQQIHWALCKLFEETGDVDKAMACASEILKLHPKNARVQVQLANQYKKMGRLEEAERAFRAALALEPLPATYSSLSQVLAARSQRADATAAMTEACRLDPDNKSYKGRLANLTAGGGDGVPEPPSVVPRRTSLSQALTTPTQSVSKWRTFLRALLGKT